MTERELSAEEVSAMAEGMGHRVLPARLEELTAGVNRLLALCATLDAFDPGGAERGRNDSISCASSRKTSPRPRRPPSASPPAGREP